MPKLFLITMNITPIHTDHVHYTIVCPNDLQPPYAVVSGYDNYLYDTLTIASSIFYDDMLVLVKAIGNDALKGLCANKVVIPHTVTEIYVHAFEGSKIKTVEGCSGLKSIDDSAFFNCVSLSSFPFNEGLERIGNLAFAYTRITALNAPSTLRSISSDTFYRTESPLTSITLPPEVDIFISRFGTFLSDKLTLTGPSTKLICTDEYMMDKRTCTLLWVSGQRAQHGIHLPSCIKRMATGVLPNCYIPFVNFGSETDPTAPYAYYAIRNDLAPCIINFYGEGTLVLKDLCEPCIVHIYHPKAKIRFSSDIAIEIVFETEPDPVIFEKCVPHFKNNVKVKYSDNVRYVSEILPGITVIGKNVGRIGTITPCLDLRFITDFHHYVSLVSCTSIPTIDNPDFEELRNTAILVPVGLRSSYAQDPVWCHAACIAESTPYTEITPEMFANYERTDTRKSEMIEKVAMLSAIRLAENTFEGCKVAQYNGAFINIAVPLTPSISELGTLKASIKCHILKCATAERWQTLADEIAAIKRFITSTDTPDDSQSL